MPSDDCETYSIEVGETRSPPFKSIDRIVWTDIPKFAVLTGLNGSGKSQLLRLLALKLTEGDYPDRKRLDRIPLKITGLAIGPDEIAYLPNADMGFRVREVDFRDADNPEKFLQGLSGIDRAVYDALVKKKHHMSVRDFVSKSHSFTDDSLFMSEYNDVAAGLGQVFLNYQMKKAEKLLQRCTEPEISEKLGVPPWEFINDALKAAEFSYRVQPPGDVLRQNYVLRVRSEAHAAVIDLNDLSSGEKIILRALLWLYNLERNKIFPKLLLLDEPDAHLHPTMTRQFIDLIKGVFVDQHGVRVILTTHSPSTVALAPEESIFVMTREQPRITRPESKAEAIGMLTSGLVIVSPGTRFVLVEDEEDAAFYGAVRDVLADQGPSKDAKAIRPVPSLVFMPAARGKGAEKTGGGRHTVTQWVEKFDAQPLSEMFRGIIDLDQGNTPSSRVLVIGRHSIENYRLDPVIIFGLLVEEGSAPSLPGGKSISSGDEHLIRELPSVAIQAMVDYVAKEISPSIGAMSDPEKKKRLVTFSNGVEVKYPAWMITRRGHDLFQTYRNAFGQHVVTPKRLDKAFRRIRMIPLELAEIMACIQDN
ncbi:AAA family ATPase [Methylocystis echinoides]|uniref:AAA family ATPase n=1 Tax=Methylocystis echinoides TaxID=29468 RepID=UPI0034171F16